MNHAFQAAHFFLCPGDIADIASLGDGNINDTYLVNLHTGERRILQRLNPAIFSKPTAVIRNMRIVLDHFHNELREEPVPATPFTMPTMFRGKTGDWYKAEDGSLWRMMSMIEGSISLSRVHSGNQAEQLGKGLGLFHRLAASLAVEHIEDTLPGFHNTEKYLQNYDRITARRKRPASAGADFCAEFIEQNRKIVPPLTATRTMLTRGVVHGDPKVDNFLFDTAREKVISLVDLDTIRPGPLLLDLGDALRSCCNSGGENAEYPADVTFDPELFAAWIHGYFSRTDTLLAKVDLQYLVDFVRLITFELGLRFYSDYLDGNNYFKIDFAEHNLLRARVQFYLVKSISKQWDRLQNLVRKASATMHDLR